MVDELQPSLERHAACLDLLAQLRTDVRALAIQSSIPTSRIHESLGRRIVTLSIHG